MKISNSDNIYSLLVDNSQLNKPDIFTVENIKDNIYHNIHKKNDNIIAFNIYNDYIESIDRSGNNHKFKNFKIIDWNNNYHLDMFITGSSSLKKFDLICNGSINKTINFNLNNSKKVYINNNIYKMDRNVSNFNWVRVSKSDSSINSDICELETDNFNYRVFSINSDQNINKFYIE